MKLELYYPAKPYIVTQAFGIFNPAYERFGYTKHNGIDIQIDADGIVRAMCECKVVEAGDYPTGAGISARLRTLQPVEAEGVTEYAEFMYMHGAKHLCAVGDVLKVGDAVIVADNTGFSTGPHTHISAYFVDPTKPIGEHKLPIGSADSDYCFDHSKYFNGLYADDVLLAFLRRVLSLAQQLLNLILKK